jgi:4-hydroxythreonine-4-phosphate dehydrogenase
MTPTITSSGTRPTTIAPAIGDPNSIWSGDRCEGGRAERARHGADQFLPPCVVLFGDAFVIRWYVQGCCLGTTLKEVRADSLPPTVPGSMDAIDFSALAAEAFAPGEVAAAPGRACSPIPAQHSMPRGSTKSTP